MFSRILLVVLFISACTKDAEVKTEYVNIQGATKYQYTDCSGEDAKLEFCADKKTSSTAVETSAALTSLQLSGELEVVGPGSLAVGASLTGGAFFSLAATDTYSLYCSTFEDTPVACSAAIDDAGKFSGKCENFAAKSFGCFLRKGGVTLTTVEFSNNGESSSSLLAGSGTLASKLVYNTETGLASADIDEAQSSAMSDSAIAEAKKSLKMNDTVLSDVTGTWKTECVVDAASGMNCDEPSAPATSTVVDSALCATDPNMCTTMPIDCALPENVNLMECANMQVSHIPDMLYLSQETTSSGDVKVGVWESKSQRDMCMGTAGTETQPEFGLKVAKTEAAVDFDLFKINLTSKKTTNASIDKAMNLLATGSPEQKALFKAIMKMAFNREQWKINQCQNNPYQDTDYTVDGTTYKACQLRPEEVETYSYIDAATNKEVSQSYPKWFWDTNDFQNDPNNKWHDKNDGIYTTAVSEVVSCTRDLNDDSGLPFCPAYAGEDNTYTKFTVQDATGVSRKLLLVCQVVENGYSWLKQETAAANNVAEAVNLANSASDCNIASYSNAGHVFNGLTKAYISAARSIFMELALSKSYYFEEENLCKGYHPNNDWDFDDCNPTDYSNYNYSGDNLCWNKYDVEQRLGVKVVSGRFVNDATATSADVNTTSPLSEWNERFYKNACPSEYDTYSSSGKTVSDLNAMARSCKTTLVPGSCSNVAYTDQAACLANSETWTEAPPVLADQINFVRQLAIANEWMPLRGLVCGQDKSSSYYKKIMGGIKNSCMADASLNMFCDETGNCMNTLRCNGTGGRCFKGGEFIGNIPGRLGLMKLKLGVDGAFSLNETKLDRWSQWGESGEEVCNATRSIALNARSASEGMFDAVYKAKESQKCEEKETDEVGTNATGTAATATGMGNAMQFERQGLGNVLMKLKFTKCNNDTCT